ncbi:Gfo/Idh/MocA family protein [Paenibacillus sp. GCM10023252]|uniref:Gfo/Idh/MocA family protein n=1 Tax=Paenibacillus sp. GCM10023252 TaxID=3252649 RepID=UPI0036087F13
MSNRYRVAFIGCGQRAHEHAIGIQADPRCQVVALSDIQAASAVRLADTFGFSDAAVYTDHKEMLAQEKPDVVVTCLWTHLHLPVFRDCALAGVKAVLCEKPMAPTWGDCLEMGRLAEETGCQLTFSHQRRMAAGNKQVRKWLDAGVFGELQRLELYAPPNLLDCGTHTFDQALSYMQECSPKWVLGAVDTSETLAWFGLPSESVVTGHVVFDNGVRATLQFGGPDMDMWGGVRVTGSKGFIEVFWDGDIRETVLYADPAWTAPSLPTSSAEQMTSMVRHVLDCLESGDEPEVSVHKALRASEIIFALYESVRRHARVEFPLQGVEDNPFVTMLASGDFPLQPAGGGQG